MCSNLIKCKFFNSKNHINLISSHVVSYVSFPQYLKVKMVNGDEYLINEDSLWFSRRLEGLWILPHREAGFNREFKLKENL